MRKRLVFFPMREEITGPFMVRPKSPWAKRRFGKVQWQVTLKGVDSRDKIFLVDSQGKTWGFTAKQLLTLTARGDLSCDLL